MTRSLAHSLWLRQTAYTVVVVTIVAAGVSFIEIASSYKNEYDRMQDFGEQLVSSFSDSAARAAFHIDSRQAQSVVDGLMQYEILDEAKITTDLGVVLAHRLRQGNTEASDGFADWLFSDVTLFNQHLSIDRGDFIAGQPSQRGDALLSVGEIVIRANASAVGSSFLSDVRTRVIGLAAGFLLLATVLAFIFYRTITKPLEHIAEQLGAIDSRSTELRNLTTSRNHRQDELGMVVDRTNQLLSRIGEQQVDLVHREKVAALGSMLAEVAHELNNPLAVVTAQAELLAETAKDKATQERAEKILRPARRSASIVRKFLSLARQRKIEKTVLDVRHLINDSVEMLSYQFANRSVVLRQEVDADVTRIWGDGPQLSQVIINVLINAQQALSACEGDREVLIHVSFISSSNRVVVAIADNGPGIPEEIRHKVFQPFFTTKPEGRGTGLGLSFCRSVIEGHGGSIEIEDVEPHGTTVHIELPGTTSHEVEKRTRAHLAQALTSLRVLVVDDEILLASSIAEALENYGHVAVTAASAAQATALMERDTFDIILADIHMSDTDGMTFYRNVQRNNAEAADRFVFITGDSVDPELIQFFNEQRRPFLYKPFEISELIRVVEQTVLAPKTVRSTRAHKEDSSNV